MQNSKFYKVRVTIGVKELHLSVPSGARPGPRLFFCSFLRMNAMGKVLLQGLIFSGVKYGIHINYMCTIQGKNAGV